MTAHSLVGGTFTLEHHGVESFGCAVDDSGQAGRAGSDDDEIVAPVLDRLPDPNRSGDLAVRRLAADELVPERDAT